MPLNGDEQLPFPPELSAEFLARIGSGQSNSTIHIGVDLRGAFVYPFE